MEKIITVFFFHHGVIQPDNKITNIYCITSIQSPCSASSDYDSLLQQQLQHCTSQIVDRTEKNVLTPCSTNLCKYKYI